MKRPKGIRLIYRGTLFRSKWEVYTAKLLLYTDTNYLYEPQKFHLLPNLSYIPDFFLPQLGAFLEVKGRLTDRDRLKIKIFRKHYPTLFFGVEEIKEVHGKSPSDLSKLDILKYVPTGDEVVRFKHFLRESERRGQVPYVEKAKTRFR